MLSDNDFLLWWALDPTYGLVSHHTGMTKAQCRRYRKRLFRARGWPAYTAKDLARYQRWLQKGTHTLEELV